MLCEEFSSNVEAYLDESLEGSDRDAWREHLRACGACREEALAREPSLLLSLGTAPRATPQQIDACARAVSVMIRQDRLSRRLRPRSRSWLAAAAALLLALGAGAVWRLGPGYDPMAGPDGGALMSAESTGDEAGGLSSATDGSRPAPEVRVDMDGEGVRVYHFAVEGDEDTTVAFVVNPALES